MDVIVDGEDARELGQVGESGVRAGGAAAVALGVARGFARARRAERRAVVVAARHGARRVAAVAERRALVARRGRVHGDVAGQAEARGVLGAAH